MKIYTFLKGRQDNKWCSLKKFDFSNRTKKMGRREYYLLFSIHEYWIDYKVQLLTRKLPWYCNVELQHKYFFFFWFPTVYPQSFQPETNHCSQRVGPNGVNCWPRQFFQSAGTQTRTGEHTQLSLGQAPWDQAPNHLTNPPGFSKLIIDYSISKLCNLH